MENAIKTIYKIPIPSSNSGEVEVYGDPDMIWYEFKITLKGEVIFDSENQQYGDASAALRDGLNKGSELELADFRENQESLLRRHAKKY